MSIEVRVQPDDFDLAAEYQQLANDPRCGAVVTFTGLVRDQADGGLKGLSLEHYPGMTEKALTGIAEQAKARWDIHQVTIIHRVGYLPLNAQIMMVAVSSAHRKAAFSAADFMMDYLKTQAPFWKKEYTDEGEFWVDAKQSDQQAAAHWQKKPV